MEVSPYRVASYYNVTYCTIHLDFFNQLELSYEYISSTNQLIKFVNSYAGAILIYLVPLCLD